MFDIVSGRETRAAVLLAASLRGFGLAQMHNDIDGLRFSRKASSSTSRREPGFM
jgi:hypothetical protein